MEGLFSWLSVNKVCEGSIFMAKCELRCVAGLFSWLSVNKVCEGSIFMAKCE